MFAKFELFTEFEKHNFTQYSTLIAKPIVGCAGVEALLAAPKKLIEPTQLIDPAAPAVDLVADDLV